MSAVRVTKIRDFDVTPPRKSAFQIETPPDVPRQHSLTIFSARRGGGKSVACTTYVKKLLEVGAMQRVIIITPTWASNKDIFAWHRLQIPAQRLETIAFVLNVRRLTKVN